MSLSPASLAFNANTDLSQRKLNGQYMTPPEVSDVLMRHITIQPGDKVLDPAVGTGELLIAASRMVPDAHYEGWDVDDHVLSFVEDDAPFTHTIHNTLEYTDQDGTFDVIVANPPYFEMKLDADLKKRFVEVTGGGRTNIFTLFFHRAVSLLQDGGTAAFIVPPSMNNGAYFAKLRAYLMTHAEIVSLEVLDPAHHFVDAQTSVQIITFRKTANPVVNEDVVFTSTGKKGEVVIFSRDARSMREAWDGAVSVWEAGYEVKTGSVVWNQHKEDFLPGPDGDAVPLIYSKDIAADGTVQYLAKLDDRRWLPWNLKSAPAADGLVVNRIVGALGKQKIRVARPVGEFFGENHVNVVTPRAGVAQKVDLDALQAALTAVPSSYLNLLTGNTQISATELAYHLPLRLS